MNRAREKNHCSRNVLKLLSELRTNVRRKKMKGRARNLECHSGQQKNTPKSNHERATRDVPESRYALTTKEMSAHSLFIFASVFSSEYLRPYACGSMHVSDKQLPASMLAINMHVSAKQLPACMLAINTLRKCTGKQQMCKCAKRGQVPKDTVQCARMCRCLSLGVRLSSFRVSTRAYHVVV